MYETPSASILEIETLCKRFGDLVAVDKLSFSVAKGEILGFLGPNGAGKSSTMRLIAGFLKPDAGEIRINGVSVSENPTLAQRSLGYLPEGAPSYGEMTPRGFLNFIASAHGLKGTEADAKIEAAKNDAQLESVFDRRIETLSKGFKRRVGLAQAILNDPPLLVLDEPTDGLDPNQKHAVRQLVQRKAENAAVLISTHTLEEVEAMCTRVIIIDQGRLVEGGVGSPEDLLKRSLYRNAVTLEIKPEHAAQAEAALSKLGDRATIEKTERAGLSLFRVRPNDGAPILGAVSDLLAQDSLAPEGLYVEPGRLDDVFRALTSSDVRTPKPKDAE